MKPEEQRIAIAEACGWKRDKTTPAEFAQSRINDIWVNPEGRRFIYGLNLPPDYLSDLNAMHEAEKVLTEDEYFQYLMVLDVFSFVEKQRVQWAASATAAQRAEAFLRTLNLYRD